jgi:hypothetical protein
MRLSLLVFLLTVACATRADTAAPAPSEPSVAPEKGLTSPPEGVRQAGDACTATANCPDLPTVTCVGKGAGRCVATDGVGCGFIPDGGQLEPHCCDGSLKCNPDPLATPPVP